MSVYSLTFDLLGVFSSGAPQLSVSYGDQELGVEYAYSGTTSVNLTIDTGSMGFDSTLLRFSFIDSSGEVGDAVRLTNLKIDGNDLDYSDFSTDRGAYFHDGVLNLSRSGYTEYDASVYVTDTMLNPPNGDVTPAATVTGTTGDDNRLYGTNDAGDVIDALAGNDYVVALDGDDTINAGDGNDYVKGQSGIDTINGGNGADRLYGGNGNDIVNGGADNDRVYGNDGDDVVRGDGGNDRVYGNAGDDDLYGGTGNDNLSGGAGADELFGEDGDDHLFGGDDNDILHGGNNNDRLRGNAGNDELHGDAGDDDLNGQDGNDTLYGGIGNDTLNGEDGNDILNGDGGNDYLIGGQGADTLNGGDGDDIIYGGGMSTVDQYLIRDGSAFGLSGVVYLEETQSFYRFISAGANYTTAEANAAASMLNGVGGHLVTITSQFENDFVQSYAQAGGSSTIMWIGAQDRDVDGEWVWSGGPEAGTQFWQGDETGVAVNNAFANFIGSNPEDGPSVYGGGMQVSSGLWTDDPQSGSRSYMIEWNADDVLADNSIDTLNGGDGDDQLYGGAGNDILNGDADNDILYGQDGNDTLNGGTGTDVLYGGAGDDDIYGNSSSDTIHGGAGSDNIYGGDLTDMRVSAIGDIQAYGAGQDGGGTTTLLDDGVGFELDGNAWKYMDVNYTITANTVIEFDFRSTLEAEISGIGFDNDLGISDNRTFKVYGDQNWGITTYDNYDGSGDWTHYTINVGSVFTGFYSYLTFVNDDDGGGVDGNGWFRNVIIHEGDNGNNTLSGGSGVDDLYGGGGTDTFHFDAISASVDRVHYFEVNDDIIDLSDIITGFTGTITDHVQIVDSGDHATLRVDADGAGGYSDVAEIWGGEGLDVATLYANGQIVV